MSNFGGPVLVVVLVLAAELALALVGVGLTWYRPLDLRYDKKSMHFASEFNLHSEQTYMRCTCNRTIY